MERDANDNLGNPVSGSGDGSDGTTSGTGGFAAGGASTGGESFGSTGGTAGSYGTKPGSYGQASTAGTERSTSDKAKARAADAKEKASEKLGQAREKAGELKNSLADKLEAGAGKLRQRGTTQPGSYASASAGTTGAAGGDGSITLRHEESKVDKVSGSVAGGMEKSAEWLRNNDLDSMKADVETKVRANPGKSLLVALGAGYLLGKIFRR
ncbi:MAG: hypothetical protein ACRENI_02435 [Gemmatimonadaceae bacterium]